MRGYTVFAVVFLNCVLGLVIINILLAAAHPLWARPRLEVKDVIADSAVYRQILPGLTPAQIVRLDSETYRPSRFDPFTFVRALPRKGEFVNVDTPGYRRIENQGAWPPDSSKVNVFMFGASTLFGTGVADSQTIPSALQRTLASMPCGDRVRVYNFGQPGFFSTQERILFEELLLEGRKPAVAVFLDGSNDANTFANGWPERAEKLDALFRSVQENRPTTATVHLVLTRVPMYRMALSAIGKLQPSSPPEYVLDYPRSIARWFGNRRLIEGAATSHHVSTLFVWQPTSKYNYEEKVRLARGWDNSPDEWTPAYRLMAARRAAGEIPDVLWLADMQKDRHDPLYVDGMHYTAAFSAEIADSIAATLRARGLVCGATPTVH